MDIFVNDNYATKKKLPNPKGLEFVYHGDHLEVIRVDGRTPTMHDMAVRDAWWEWFKLVGKCYRDENIEHHPILKKKYV